MRTAPQLRVVQVLVSGSKIGVAQSVAVGTIPIKRAVSRIRNEYFFIVFSFFFQ
jgi:hypothetical protein